MSFISHWHQQINLSIANKMHAYTLPNIILVLLVASPSFLIPPNSITVEARKFSTSNDVFKVDLIHRDSPLSPYYNSSMTPKERLKRAALGYISHGHSIQHNKSDAKSYALKFYGGEYLMKIALGTPKVEFLVVADTGSDLIWVQCQSCNTTNTCFSQQSPLFDPSKSSTYSIIPCTSSRCTHPDLGTSCTPYNTTTNNNNNSSESCYYQSIYVDKRQSSGILATETITLPSLNPTSISLSHAIFGCGTNQQGPYSSPQEGFAGLGAGPSSLVSQLGPKINYKFSYCLAPLSSGVSSKLTFGADVTGPKVVSTPFTIGGGTQPTFYNLTLNGISLRAGDKNNTVQVQLNSGLGIIIDSGTTLTMLPTDTYISLKYYLKTAIGLNTIPSPLEDYDLCYNSSTSLGQQFSPPNVVFQFQGADVVLKAFNTFREIEEDVSCLAMMATNGTPIFGNIAQVNFEVGYDVQAKQVSFAPTDCTNY